MKEIEDLIDEIMSHKKAIRSLHCDLVPVINESVEKLIEEEFYDFEYDDFEIFDGSILLNGVFGEKCGWISLDKNLEIEDHGTI